MIETENSKSTSVLVVDDNELLVEVITELVHSMPGMLLVGSATSGEGAIEMVREHMPHIVLLDYGMPGMNGLEVARLIKQISNKIKIIGMSVDDALPIVREFKQLGSQFVRKDMLVQKLPALLNGS